MSDAILLLMLLAALLGVSIGYAVGKMPCWETWQGYVGLLIVAPLVIVAGVSVEETIIDCVALGCGFACAQRVTLCC